MDIIKIKENVVIKQEDGDILLEEGDKIKLIRENELRNYSLKEKIEFVFMNIPYIESFGLFGNTKDEGINIYMTDKIDKYESRQNGISLFFRKNQNRLILSTKEIIDVESQNDGDIIKIYFKSKDFILALFRE